MRIPLKQTISQHKLLLLSFVFFFLFSGMVSVFADENSGGYAPGESLNPTCAPNTSDCLVVTGWQLNTVDNYVFNTTDLVGIGTNTPTSTLDIVGDLHVLDGSGELTIDSDFVWEGDSSSFTSSIAGVTLDGLTNANEFNTTLSASATIANSSYRGLASTITYNGSDTLSGTAPDLFSAPLVGFYGSVLNTGTADIPGGIQGGLFLAHQSGNGATGDIVGSRIYSAYSGTHSPSNVESVVGLRTHAINVSSGDVDSIEGVRFNAANAGPGDAGFAYGITGAVTNDYAGGTITDAYAADLQVRAVAGTISNATLLKLASFVSTGTIGNVTGIAFNAGVYTPDEIPGLESIGDTKGISFSDYNTHGALEGNNVYGIYFNDSGALQGVADEYALYIGDTDAENWFSNGLRIGTDDDTYKIDSESNGGSSSTLYIGNEAIDTSVSDRRLKTDITDAEGSALDFVDQFDVVQFNWLSENDRSEYGMVPFGLIAQDVAELSPGYARIPNDPNNYYSVRFSDMVPMLIKAVQELRVQIATQVTAVGDSVQNFFVDTFTARHATVIEEFCVGNTCINEQEFSELVSQIRDNSSNTSDEEEEDLGDDDQIADEGGVGDLIDDGSGDVVSNAEESEGEAENGNIGDGVASDGEISTDSGLSGDTE